MLLPKAAEFMRCALGVLAVLEVLLIMIPVKPGVVIDVRCLPWNLLHNAVDTSFCDLP